MLTSPHKLALIIPTLNRITELWRLLRSLANQSRLPEEIIIIGEERKEVEEVAKKFPQLKIKIISLPQESISKKRNIGIKTVSAEITLIGFLDDDVILTPKTLERMLAFWEKASSDVGGVGFNFLNPPPLDFSWLKSLPFAFWLGLYSREKGAVLPSGIQTQIGSVSETTYVRWLPAVAVYPKKIFEENGFDEWFKDFSYLEDLDFSYRVGKKYKLIVIGEAGFYHYPSPQGRVDPYLFGKKEVINRLYFVKKYSELSLLRCYLALFLRTFLSIILGITKRDFNYFKRTGGNLIGLIETIAEGK